MAISGLIGMILPYVIIAVLAYMAYRWFKGRAKAAGKAIVKGAKVVGTTVVKGGKVVGQTAVKVSNKDDDMRKAAMKGDKKAIAKFITGNLNKKNKNKFILNNFIIFILTNSPTKIFLNKQRDF